jgi:hypothetical protein
MGKNRFGLFAVITVALNLGAPSTSSAHDLTGVLGDLQDLFVGCATSGQMLQDVDITADMLSPRTRHWGNSYHDGGTQTCHDFTWFNRPLYNAPHNNVFIDFGGPNIVTSAADCQHTMLQFGVYKRFTGGAWQLVSLGYIYGKLQNGTCTHSYTAANAIPSRWHTETGEVGNAPHVAIYGGPVLGGTTVVGEIRIAAYSWVHNDPAIGHPGNVCGSTDCYFGTNVVAW